MTDIRAVKTAVVNLLKADVTLQGLLGKDSRGNYPVYHTFIEHALHKPCITIEDVTDQAEVSSLEDGYDGSKRYQWQHAVIQVDCWSMKNADERDQLEIALQKCLLENPVNGTIYVQEPAAVVLDEADVKPPLWRKSLRFRVMYVLEVS